MKKKDQGEEVEEKVTEEIKGKGYEEQFSS
jgi:hypothetical protein